MSDSHQIQVTIEQAKAMQKSGRALDRLRKNPDFKHVIEDLYLVQNAARLVGLLADKNMQAPEQQASIVAEMRGVSSLADFFRIITQNGDNAEQALEDNEAELARIREEEGVEGEE